MSDNKKTILCKKKDLVWPNFALDRAGLLWLNELPLPYVRTFPRLHLLRLWTPTFSRFAINILNENLFHEQLLQIKIANTNFAPNIIRSCSPKDAFFNTKIPPFHSCLFKNVWESKHFLALAQIGCSSTTSSAQLTATTRRYSTLFDATRRYSTLLDAIRRYSTLLDAIRRYSRLLEATRLYSMLLDAARRYSTLLYATQRYSTLLDATHRYSDASRCYSDAIRCYSTLLNVTRRYSTLLDATRRYSTLLDATRRYSTLLQAIRRYLTSLQNRGYW
jgi:hypothetical protein